MTKCSVDDCSKEQYSQGSYIRHSNYTIKDPFRYCYLDPMMPVPVGIQVFVGKELARPIVREVQAEIVSFVEIEVDDYKKG